MPNNDPKANPDIAVTDEVDSADAEVISDGLRAYYLSQTRYYDFRPLVYYQQISGDSGSGAQLGSFAGMTVGIGPVLSFVYKLGAVNLGAEAKWLHELDTTNRMKGNIAWLKLYINAPF